MVFRFSLKGNTATSITQSNSISKLRLFPSIYQLNLLSRWVHRWGNKEERNGAVLCPGAALSEIFILWLPFPHEDDMTRQIGKMAKILIFLCFNMSTKAIIIVRSCNYSFPLLYSFFIVYCFLWVDIFSSFTNAMGLQISTHAYCGHCDQTIQHNCICMCSLILIYCLTTLS